MTGRREVDRRDPGRGERERDEFAARRQPAPAAAEPPRRPQLNEFWIDGEGINRQVLQTEICKYLGAEATCRPGEYQGVAGFKIKALRPFTPDMLDDLRNASKAFTTENRAFKARHSRGNTTSISPSPAPDSKIGGAWLTPPPELAYNDSQTYETNTNNQMDYERPPSMSLGRDSPASYANSSAYPGPPVSAPPPNYPPSSAAYGGSSSYPAHAGIPTSSSMPMDSRYVPSVNGNGNGNGYNVPPPARDMREPLHSRDPRDMRPEPSYGSSYQDHGNYHNGPSTFNDPYPGRADPRMPAPEYYGSGQYSGARPVGRDQNYYNESMQGMSGPGSYAPAPSRGPMSPYENQGHGHEYRAPPPSAVDPRYRGR